jgi:hypothetical protein
MPAFGGVPNRLKNNKSLEREFQALVTLINLTYYYCHKDKPTEVFHASINTALTDILNLRNPTIHRFNNAPFILEKNQLT